MTSLPWPRLIAQGTETLADEAARNAKVLRFVLLTLLAFVILRIPIVSFLSQDKLPLSVGLAAIILIEAVAAFLIRHASVRAASSVLVFGLWCITALHQTFAGGVTSPLAFYFVIACVFAAFLLGREGLAVCVLLTLAALTLMFIAQVTGHAPARRIFASPAESYFTLALAIILVTVPLTFFVADQKNAERALRKSEEKFSKAFRASPSPSAISSLQDGRFMDVNEAFEKESGYARTELIGHTPFELGFWRSSPLSQELIERLKSGIALRDHEVTAETKAGQPIVVKLSAELIVIGEQRCVLMVGQNITQAKQSELILRQSEAEFRSLFLQAPCGMYRADHEGRFLIVNQALVELLGYEDTADLALSRRESELYQNPEDWGRVMENAEYHTDRRGIEVPWKRKDGAVILVRLNSRTILSSSGEIEFYETMVEDITQQRIVERNLQYVQKMEAVGQLASGVAHDFNNLLTGILGYSELILRTVDPKDPRHQKLTAMVSAAKHGRDLTSRLLACGQGDAVPLYPLNLDGALLQIKDICGASVGESIHIQLDLRCGSEFVMMTTGLLYQLLLNLAVNARDAMPRGGRITISTDSVEIPARSSGAAGIEPGRYLRLAVSDTGIGMDKATQDRLFEPFFTTKGAGKGTGLGLYSVFGIVRQCSGKIRVFSEVGKGSTFEIHFPQVDPPRLSPSSESPHPSKPRTAELILVVEDNDSAMEAVRDQLTHLGYAVICEPSAGRALHRMEQLENDVSLLVSDVVMPDVSGPDLARHLRRTRPDLKVLYMTGYAQNQVLPPETLLDGSDLLVKPFTLDELDSKIRNLLARTARTAT